MTSLNRLITIPISHFCEKARWALDRAGVEYSEEPHLQMLHIVASRRAGGTGTAPVLVTADRGVLADSSDIVAYAHDRAPSERRLYPTDPAAREEVRALERDFDENLGPQGRLWMYHHILPRPDLARTYGTRGVPAWQRWALPPLYPAVSRLISHKLGVTAAAAVAADHRVRATFDLVAERLGDGGPYLCGHRFTAADLTFSALAGAVLMPPQWSIPLPQPKEIPPAAAARVRAFREHPAGRHALRMFTTERR
ncbi:MAG: glutathione S-transferase family protein [Actinomycetota bacterium]|nr:glutathione S-transferase family protein [Actinomycetota bacterium]